MNLNCEFRDGVCVLCGRHFVGIPNLHYHCRTKYPIDINKPVSRGLGDTIARLTKAIGWKPCAGCNKRRRALNRLLPYR